MTTAPLTIVDYKIEDLEAFKNPKNPRWMPEPQKEALIASIQSFGIVEPVILNTRTKQVVGGHQRIDAAKEAGEKTLPVVLVDLEPAKEIALNLLLNKVRGDWDYEKLAPLLAELDGEELIATGFSEDEISSIANSFTEFDMSDLETEGVVQEIRNRTDEEVREAFESTEKVQFGMFSRAVPVAEYDRWIAFLKSKSTMGESPAALGAVIAELLGIEIQTEGEDDELSTFDGTEGEDDEYTDE
jgi:hypothetical protein